MKEYKLTQGEFWYIFDHPTQEQNGKYIIENYATFYFKNGKEHKEDAPACEYNNGDKYWCIDGKFHRLDGPAIEFANGRSRYYINGTEYLEEDYPKAVENYKTQQYLEKYNLKIIK